MRDQIARGARSGGVAAVLAAAVFVLSGCDVKWSPRSLGQSTTVETTDDGTTRVTIEYPGYDAKLTVTGSLSVTADESDLASLQPRGTFTFHETFEGETHDYTVRADGAGVLTRRFRREGHEVPADAAERRWLAAALPRMFRESGVDAEAQVVKEILA